MENLRVNTSYLVDFKQYSNNFLATLVVGEERVRHLDFGYIE